MQFESFSFLVSLALACLIYWGIPPSRGIWRKYLLLILSYVFYSLFDWRFSFFLFFITIFFFVVEKGLFHLTIGTLDSENLMVGTF